MYDPRSVVRPGNFDEMFIDNPAIQQKELIRWNTAGLTWRDDVYCEFNGYETTLLTSRMVRTTRWKYDYNPYDLDELYDMQSDPGELHNLTRLPAFSHVLRRMKKRLVYRLRRTGDRIIETTVWQSNSYGLILSDRER